MSEVAFAQQEHREFTQEAVRKYGPEKQGVYGLFREDTCVFVGKGHIRYKLYGHLAKDNVCINVAWPSHCVCEVTENADARWKELLLALNPGCNKDDLAAL